MFFDISSSFTDFFGGRSGTYEKKINKLFEDAKINLIAKVRTSGADGIIGFSVELNEITGKDKGMLMVSIYGTPIKMEQLIDSSSYFESVEYETFEKKLQATSIVRKYDVVENMMISKRDLDFVISSQVIDLEDFVFNLVSLK